MDREVSSTLAYASGVGQGDGKLYFSTDSRLIYCLNASDGSKLGFYTDAELANGWSSPAVYEGHMYIGNSNWNVYAFADYPSRKPGLPPAPSPSPTAAPTAAPTATVAPTVAPTSAPASASPTATPATTSNATATYLVIAVVVVIIIIAAAAFALRRRK